MIENGVAPHESKGMAWILGYPALMLLTAIISSVPLLWLLFQYPSGFDSPSTLFALAILLIDTLVVLFLIRNPIPKDTTGESSHTGRLIGLILACAAVFFTLPLFFKGPILYALPPIACLTLIALKQPVSRREVGYAATLAVIAGAAGLANGAISGFSPVVWGALQVFLVLSGLLCGWKILQSTGLAAWGIGNSRWLSSGAVPALRGLGLGMLLAIPWAIGNVVLGGAAHDTWVKAWWQPFVAIQPGIAEEAWGRLLIIPLLYLVFRLAAQPRTAFGIALVFGSYWFAYLHTHMGLEGIISTFMIGTIILPIAYLCLYRDLETAIGWHFAIDFVRFLSALILLSPK